SNNQVSTYSIAIKQFKKMGDTMVLLSTIHRNHTSYVVPQANFPQDAQTLPSYTNYYDINETDNVCAGNQLDMHTFIRNISGSTLSGDFTQGSIPFTDTTFLWGSYRRYDLRFQPDTTHIRENLYRVV